MLHINAIKCNFDEKLKNNFSKNEITSLWKKWVVPEIFRISLIESYNVDLEINTNKVTKINLLIRHLLNNLPVQYFFGFTYFCENKIKVDSSVLIPRVETEELVHLVVSKIKTNTCLNIIDIGTGSGCIAISLAKFFKSLASIFAVDICSKALMIAESNARINNVQINFSILDILNSSQNYNLPKMNIIISNPPYVVSTEVDKFSNIHAEPSKAIFVEEKNPLIFYESICLFAKKKLHKNGIIFFEINPIFYSNLLKLLHKYGYLNIETHNDIFGKKRFIVVYS